MAQLIRNPSPLNAEIADGGARVQLLLGMSESKQGVVTMVLTFADSDRAKRIHDLMLRELQAGHLILEVAK